METCFKAIFAEQASFSLRSMYMGWGVRMLVEVAPLSHLYQPVLLAQTSSAHTWMAVAAAGLSPLCVRLPSPMNQVRGDSTASHILVQRSQLSFQPGSQEGNTFFR